MKIEVGKCYQTRDGRRAKVIGKGNDVFFPFSVLISGVKSNPDNEKEIRYLVNEIGQYSYNSMEHNLDLVVEVETVEVKSDKRPTMMEIENRGFVDKPEELENKYIRLIKSIKGYPPAYADVYSILNAFEVTCPAIQHAVKKLLCCGQRGSKTTLQDLKEANQAVNRAIELEEYK